MMELTNPLESELDELKLLIEKTIVRIRRHSYVCILIIFFCLAIVLYVFCVKTFGIGIFRVIFQSLGEPDGTILLWASVFLVFAWQLYLKCCGCLIEAEFAKDKLNNLSAQISKQWQLVVEEARESISCLNSEAEKFCESFLKKIKSIGGS